VRSGYEQRENEPPPDFDAPRIKHLLVYGKSVSRITPGDQATDARDFNRIASRPLRSTKSPRKRACLSKTWAIGRAPNYETFARCQRGKLIVLLS
jgi:hypothetical protein